MEKVGPCFENLKFEEEFDENKVSGVNLMEKCLGGAANCNPNLADPKNPCSEKGYRYICEDRTHELYPNELGWKEVALVKPNYGMQIRIRWARTDYIEGSGEAFFSEKERNLIEFPGYVYHCHFLPHEDHEMMRSFMMQPSGREETANWDQEFLKINKDAKKDQGK